MNKNQTFFTAPVTALFLPQVYRDAAKNPAGRGIFYLLYLTLLSTVLITVLLMTVIAPQGDRFAKWFGENMPTLIWTPQGLELEGPAAEEFLTMTHPQLGPIVEFDMKRTAVTEQDFGTAYVFVTARKIYLKKAPGQIQEYDVTRNAEQSKQLPPRIKITGDITGKFYQNLKGALFFVTPIVVFPVLFLIYLFGNLLYSLAGLLFNLMRKNRLGYGAIFNVTCFATTAGFTLAWLKALLPLRGIPIPFVLYILLNLAYLVFAFKITDDGAEA